MSFALWLNTLLTTMALGAAPTPCPEGQTRAPIGVVDGAVRTACRAIEEVETTKATVDDAARYAAMEKAASPKVEEFRGGDAVIYISTGAAIVIIVLLILLI